MLTQLNIEWWTERENWRDTMTAFNYNKSYRVRHTEGGAVFLSSGDGGTTAAELAFGLDVVSVAIFRFLRPGAMSVELNASINPLLSNISGAAHHSCNIAVNTQSTMWCKTPNQTFSNNYSLNYIKWKNKLHIHNYKKMPTYLNILLFINYWANISH